MTKQERWDILANIGAEQMEIDALKTQIFEKQMHISELKESILGNEITDEEASHEAD